MARVQPSPLNPFNAGGGMTPLGNFGAKGGNFAALAALIVRLPLRQNVGFRLLTWSNIIVVTLAMLALNWFDNVHFSLFSLFGGGVVYGDNTALRNFALVWAALAVFERFRRLDEEKRGAEPHNFSPGSSRLGLAEFIPLSPKLIAVAVEPALGFLCGALLRRLGFGVLGWVIIAASVCFSISEWRLYQQTREHRRDMRDLTKEGRWESDLVKQSPPAQEAQSEGEPIGTGIDGLEELIANRKRAGAGETAHGGEL